MRLFYKVIHGFSLGLYSNIFNICIPITWMHAAHIIHYNTYLIHKYNKIKLSTRRIGVWNCHYSYKKR